MTLKAALKILSDQTGCVFSYDPTKISDKQELNISKLNKLTLHSALQKILPKSIYFKFTGKYVVLQKSEFTKVEIPEKTLATPFKIVQSARINTEVKMAERTDDYDSLNTIVKKDSIIQCPKIMLKIPISEKALTNISIPQSLIENLKPNFQSKINRQDTLEIIKLKSKPVFELEFAENNHLATISTHLGLNNIYSIISIGSDYYKSYHLGVGAGINFQNI